MQLARVAARTDRGLQLHRVANNRAFIGDMHRGFCTLVLFIYLVKRATLTTIMSRVLSRCTLLAIVILTTT